MMQKMVRDQPKVRFGQGLAELLSLSVTSIPTLCGKVWPNFGQTLAEPKVQSITTDIN